MRLPANACIYAVAFCIFSLYTGTAQADDHIVPLAESGDWMAIEHLPSVTDPPDVCLAMEPDANFFIRADDTDVQFRLGNDSWSLPTSVTGTLELDVNGDKYPLDITGNTSTMVSAIVANDQLLKIVADMNKASFMTVIAGTAAPVQVSLNGSNTVLTAFLTCANIEAPSLGGGADPFSSPSANQ